MRRLAILLAIAVTLGCSDPRAANQTNFGAAIESYLEVGPQPVVEISCAFPCWGYELSPWDENMLRQLELAGLVSTFTTDDGRYTRFDLTAEGGAIAWVFEDDPYVGSDLSNPVFGSNVMYRDRTLFYYGRYRLQSIDGFTIPAEFRGQTISRVKFSYTAEIAEWIKDAKDASELVEASWRVARDLQAESEPISETALLVLTDEGWVHKDLLEEEDLW